jgi:16S rRNA (cytosine967-C5)-methyltransferase
MDNERQIALKALLSFRKDGSWPDLYLKQHLDGLDESKAALCANITYGVLQHTSLLDFYIAHYSALPLKKIASLVLESMRMAVYQMVFLDRIPVSAAVNESVKLIKKTGNARAAGFANGVLRAIGREKDALPPVALPTVAETLAVRYSHPRWMVERFLKLFGREETERLLAADNAPAPAVLRVNTQKGSAEQFAADCEALTGEAPVPVEGLDNAFTVTKTSALLKSDLFLDGRFSVQDTSSQLAVRVLDPRPGDRLLDVCAAPGGKSMLAAQYMEERGEVIACDLYPHKVDLIDEAARRLGLTAVQALCKDATLDTPQWAGRFDRVLCDVPCSGLGVIRKKPDIRYKDEKELASLPPLQRTILRNAAACVRPGGRLLYSTCTILPEENEDNVRDFLSKHGDFALVPFAWCGRETDGMITLLPHRDGADGFFIALLERRA